MRTKKPFFTYCFLFFFILLIISNLIFLRGLIDETLIPRFTFVSIALLMVTVFLFRDLNRFAVSSFRITDVGIILFYLVSLCSVLWAANKPEAIYVAEKTFLFVCFFYLAKFFIYTSYEFALNIILYCILAYSVLLLIIVIPQIQDIRESYRIDRRTIQAIIGFSGNKNLLSGVFLLLMPFSLIGMFRFRSFIRLLFVFNFLGLAYVLYIMETRSVFLSLVVFVITVGYLFLVLLRKNHRKPLLLPFFIAPGLVVLTFFIALATGTFERLPELTNIMQSGTKTGTWLERIFIWSRSFEMFQDHVFVGVGAGNWNLHFPLVGLDGMTKGEAFSAFIARPHNDLLWILAELGLIGFLVYAVIWYGFLKGLYRKLSRRVSKKHVIHIILLTGGLMAYLTYSLFSFPKERIEHSLFLALYLALISYHIRKDLRIFRTKPVIVKGALLGMIVLLAFNVYLGSIRLSKELISSKMSIAYGNNDLDQLMELAPHGDHPLYSMTPTGTPIDFYRGVEYLDRMELSDAIEHFKRAKKVNPGFLGTYVNLGISYFYSGHYEVAIDNYETALQISSTHLDANYNMALLYFTIGEPEKSRSFLMKLPDSDSRKQTLLQRME